MALKIFNTITKTKEEFKPIESGKVKIYLCGPTVYNYFHIGNARPLIIFDIFRRYLKYRGFDVRFVVNITDIDDRIIKKAIKEKISTSEVASKFTQAYFEDASKLGIERPDISPRATDHVNDMIEIIQRLMERGFAYQINGDVYYGVEKFENYGKLSGKNIDELQSGARVEVDERKKAPLDFALWKAAKPEEPYWESPWGKGRPGWHIECSVMSMKYLGETFDIHAGGVDLIFPHHENEIAQSEGTTGKKFVNYWMHNGFLNIEGEKMSKSLGNFFTAREIMDKYRPEVIRMFFLLKHYRSPINFSEQRILESRQAIERISSTLRNIDIILQSYDNTEKMSSSLVDNIKQEFIEAMDDDFNTASAMSKIFDLVKEANLILVKENLTNNDKQILNEIKDVIFEFNAFLGILSSEQIEKFDINEEAYINILIDVRQKLREQKHWELADNIRDRLKEMGVELEDRKEKTIWVKK
ncbi:MAG: cysteine--tRNA ligase [bacterium]|nr:MAG: cysteine--tRNA ligase [bacterium]